MLSQRLAALELLDLDVADVSEVLVGEATGLVGAERGLLWLYQPSIERLFVEQQGQETRSIEVPDASRALLFERVDVWPRDVEGVRRDIAELSFGVAAHARPPALVMPLRSTGGPLGLIVSELAPDAAPPSLRAVEILGQQASAVLFNHQALLRTRRHEAQLEALYQTAREVSGNLDLQTVLDAIAERARKLVQAPVGYVTLHEPGGDEMYMRTAVGVASTEFREIRLRIGSGLGGASAESDRPVYTSDYLNDARFLHTTSVDAAVRAERIKSILGVPLRSADVLVGVLYVADRSVRAFSESDVEILQNLARHAVVAINNAGLYQQATEALAQISRVNQVAERQNRLLRETEEMHRRLSEVVLGGDGLGSISEVLAELVGGHVVVMDEHGGVRSSAGASGDAFGAALASGALTRHPRTQPVEHVVRAVAAFESCALPPDGQERLRQRLVVPVVARGEVLGSVWAEADAETVRVRRAMEEAARVIALELLKEASIAEVERRMGRELLDALLSERPAAAATLQRRGADVGVDLMRPHRLAVATAADTARGARRARGDLSRRLLPLPEVAFVGEFGGRVVALLDEEAGRSRGSVARAVEAAGAKLIVSGRCATPDAYRASFVAADRALALLGDELAGPVVDLEDLRVVTLLFGGERQVELREFVARSLGPLVRPDERQGPDLLRTLEAYLDAGGSATRAASALHVHVNTVYYRLDRLREMLGDALDDPRKVLDLQVGLLAHRLLVGRLGNSSKGPAGIS